MVSSHGLTYRFSVGDGQSRDQTAVSYDARKIRGALTVACVFTTYVCSGRRSVKGVKPQSPVPWLV